MANLFRSILASVLGFQIRPNGDEAGSIEHAFVDVTVDLSTSGPTTNIPLNIPAGSIVDGVAIAVLEDVAGVEAGATGTLTLTGGNTEELGEFALASLVEGPLFTGMAPGDINWGVYGSEADATFTFAKEGGSDLTPSAGRLRIVVHYRQVKALA